MRFVKTDIDETKNVTVMKVHDSIVELEKERICKLCRKEGYFCGKVLGQPKLKHNSCLGSKSLHSQTVLGLGSREEETKLVDIRTCCVEKEIVYQDNLLTSYAQTLWDECKTDLNITQQQHVITLLAKYSDVFARSKSDLTIVG